MSSCLRFKWRMTFSLWSLGLFFGGAGLLDSSLIDFRLYILMVYLLLAGPIIDIRRNRKGPSNPIRTLSSEGLDDYLLPLCMLAALPVVLLRFTRAVDYDQYLSLLRWELVAVCLLVILIVKTYPRQVLVKFRRHKHKDKKWRKVVRGAMVLFLLPVLDCFTGKFLFGDVWRNEALCAVAYFLAICCLQMALMLYGSLAVQRLSPRSSGPERAV